MTNTIQAVDNSQATTQEDFEVLNRHFISIGSRVKQIVLKRVMEAIRTGSYKNPNALRNQARVITSRFTVENQHEMLHAMNRLIGKLPTTSSDG